MKKNIKIFRKEKKFLVPFDQRNLFKCWLLNRSRSIQHHPKRKIHSIYFDDYKLSAAYANLSGYKTREKFRIRWYETNSTISNAQLELKFKNNIFSYKETILLDKKITDINLTQIFKTQNLIRLNCSNFFLELSLKNKLIPVLHVSYDRNYFKTPYLNFNYDENLSYKMSNSKSDFINDWENILEIKIPDNKDKLLNDYISQSKMLFKQLRNSKYVKGLAKIGRVVYF